MREWISQSASGESADALDQLRSLVDVSSPSGDAEAGEAAMVELMKMLPEGTRVERRPSSTPGCADDMVVKLSGSGSASLLLMGHIDTVFSHQEFHRLEIAADRLIGSGTYDMKGGLVTATALMRSLAGSAGLFSEICLLVTADEEVRSVQLDGMEEFAGVAACLCFEGGEVDGQRDIVIARRKGAAMLEIEAHGRSAHSGVNPGEGRSALLALASLAGSLAAQERPWETRINPVGIRSGEHVNRIPDSGHLSADVRSFSAAELERAADLVPAELTGVHFDARVDERFPPMDSRDHVVPAIDRASFLLGRDIDIGERGGSSDACFAAPHIPVTIDGLGPLGGQEHGPDEYVLASSFAPRLELAIAIAIAALGS